MPNLSKMQKRVVDEAYQCGYYSYPRKTNIEKIAKRMNISFATCQEHLRNAEIKLMHFMIKRIESEESEEKPMFIG